MELSHRAKSTSEEAGYSFPPFSDFVNLSQQEVVKKMDDSIAHDNGQNFTNWFEDHTDEHILPSIQQEFLLKRKIIPSYYECYILPRTKSGDLAPNELKYFEDPDVKANPKMQPNKEREERIIKHMELALKNHKDAISTIDKTSKKDSLEKYEKVLRSEALFLNQEIMLTNINRIYDITLECPFFMQPYGKFQPFQGLAVRW